MSKNKILVEGQYIGFPCPNSICDKIFKSEHSLYIHVKYHCGKPPRFQCVHCGKKSHIKNNLMMHSKKKHGLLDIDIRELYTYRPLKSNIF